MWETLRDRVKDLAVRGGLGGVGRGTVIVLLLVGAAAGAFSLVRWRASDQAVRLERVTSESATDGLSADSGDDESNHAVEATAALEPTGTATVHVVGAVLRPGVYELGATDRVADAVGRAGGLLGGAAQEGINLARQLVDGEQIRVPTSDELSAFLAGESSGASPAVALGGAVAYTGPGVLASEMEQAGGGSGEDVGPNTDDRIDVNHASQSELETLPGVGPSIAGAIIRDREENGPFGAVEDLLRVSGIGEARLEAIADLVVIR